MLGPLGLYWGDIGGYIKVILGLYWSYIGVISKLLGLYHVGLYLYCGYNRAILGFRGSGFRN